MLKKKKTNNAQKWIVITFNYYADEYKLFETLYIYIYREREREFKLHLI